MGSEELFKKNVIRDIKKIDDRIEKLKGNITLLKETTEETIDNQNERIEKLEETINKIIHAGRNADKKVEKLEDDLKDWKEGWVKDLMTILTDYLKQIKKKYSAEEK